MIVSIPSSSGHQFTVLVISKADFEALVVSIPSSSGHQFTVPFLELHGWQSNCKVSIPSSSGHQFTGWPVRFVNSRRALVSIPSSSGHQFTDHDSVAYGSRIDLVSIPSSSGHQFTGRHIILAIDAPAPGFNPFFIRASVYWHDRMVRVCSEMGLSFNPFFIRASVYWSARRPGPAVPYPVSIPSSSGHQFTGKPYNVGSVRNLIGVSIPSSSGHQFTGHAGQGVERQRRGGFNPFFIRASVYCSSFTRADTTCRLRFNPFFIRASVYCVQEP